MIVKDAIPWVAIPLAGAAIATVFGVWWVAIPLAIIAAFMLFFFRDPRRAIPEDDLLVVSPADGRVTRVEKIVPGGSNSQTVVSIFLSPFDVHINRAPIAGEIAAVSYRRGKFIIATRDEASIVNEQNTLEIRGDRITVTCTQIAGVLARRIVCWKRVGDHVELGERFGLIKFGSRTDLVMPPEVEVTVKVGTRVHGGISVVGRIRDGG